MNNKLIDERADSPVGQPFRVCASKTEAEALELTKTNPNILYFSSDTNTIIFNSVMRTNPTPDLSSVLKKTDIIDNTSTNDNTKVLSAKQGKLLNDTKLNKTDVIGNLTNTDDTKALAASQGKILNDNKIDKTAIENTVNSSDVNRVLSASMGKYLNDNKIAKSEIVDDTSTDDATKPLSARQGKFLSDEITNVENSVQDIYAEIPTKTSELTNDSNYVTTNNVLTKTNTTEYNPTDDYHPATKNYVDNINYGKSLTIPNVNTILNPTLLQGQDAQSKIDELFGGAESFKGVVEDILIKHTRYYFHFDNNFTNCIELGCINAWRNNERTSYELHFIVVYNTNNIYYTSRISVIYNVDVNATKYYVANLVQSDNLTTVTKKTKSEYDAINPKNDNTMYAVTE